MNLIVVAPKMLDYISIAHGMRDDEKEQFAAMSGLSEYDPDVVARCLYMQRGPSWAAANEEGRVVLISGYEDHGPGTAELWLAAPATTWDTNWVDLTRIGRKMISFILDTHHRVQILSLASRTKAHDWYERGLKMQYESTLKKYCADGQDAVMHVRTRP